MNKRRISIILALALVICMALSLPASAETYISSAPKTITYGGVSYTVKITAVSRPSGTCGIQADFQVSQQVQAGTFGVRPRMYTGAGALYGTGDWMYNPAPTSGIMFLTGTGQTFTSGLYYAQCDVHIFDAPASRYLLYSSNRTPNFYCPSLSKALEMEIEPMQVNQNGETYGSSYYSDSTETTPDLILAIGTNGEEGYIKRIDFEESNNITIEQVLEGVEFEDKAIPLYEADGTTVIGEFNIRVAAAK